MRVLITGAANGLGLALTKQLLADGNEVCAFDRQFGALENLSRDGAGNCTFVEFDLVDTDQIPIMIKNLHTSDTNPFDLVILNAGISATGQFEKIPSQAYERLIRINLMAPITMANSLVAEDQIAAGGKFVFISSLSHVTGYPGASVYGATKSGLATYAKSVRAAWKKRNIGVLTVFPGPVRTDHAARHAPPGADESKRMPPETLANLVLKAASTNKKTLYPGGAAKLTSFVAKLFPSLTTKLMRRIIFDRLDKTTYD